MSLDDSITSFGYPVCDWLKQAKIYNHKYKKVPNTLILDRVDTLVLYFSMLNVDRHNVMSNFCDIYRHTWRIQLPLEVINVPMDENRKDMWTNFDGQPGWYTLGYGDSLITTLQYRYGITAVPHLLVIKLDGTIISTHGILDLDVYGKNALIAWLSTAAIRPQRLTRGLSILDMCDARFRKKFVFPKIEGTVKKDEKSKQNPEIPCPKD